MNMNRRNVLLGLGTAAAGSGAVFGSGAFTQVSATRDVAVSVAEDSGSVVELTLGASGSSGTDVGGADDLAQATTSNGVLQFNLNNEAINAGSTLQLGDPDNPDSDPAFSIGDGTTFTTNDNSAGSLAEALAVSVEITNTGGTPNASLEIEFSGSDGTLDETTDGGDVNELDSSFGSVNTTARLDNNSIIGSSDQDAKFLLNSPDDDGITAAEGALRLTVEETSSPSSASGFDVTIRAAKASNITST